MTPSDPPQPIPEIELINEQRKDTMCQQISLTAGTPKSQFHFDNRGILVRVSPLDGVSQKVVPVSLRKRVTELSHSPISQGHPGETLIYQTMRQKYYWPLMAGDLIYHVRTCTWCIKANGINGKKRHKKNCSRRPVHSTTSRWTSWDPCVKQVFETNSLP